MKGITVVLIAALVSITCFFFQASNISAKEGENQTIRLTYSFERPSFSEVTVFDKPFHRISMPQTVNFHQEGEPLLPVRAARILLPFGREAGKITVVPGRKVMLDGIFNIEPGQRPIALKLEDNYEVKFVPPNARTYNSSAPYPESHFFAAQTVDKRGYRILIISLSPVSYIPKAGEVAYYEKLTVNVETGPEKSSPVSFRGLAKDAKIVKNQVDNPQLIATYPVR